MITYGVFWLDERVVDGNNMDITVLDSIERKPPSTPTSIHGIFPGGRQDSYIRISEDLDQSRVSNGSERSNTPRMHTILPIRPKPLIPT